MFIGAYGFLRGISYFEMKKFPSVEEGVEIFFPWIDSFIVPRGRRKEFRKKSI